MNRRKNALLLSLLTVLSLVPAATMVGVVKASPTRVYVDYHGRSEIYDITMVPGTQFTVNITVDYVDKLSVYQFLMFFNPKVLKGVKVENGPFLGSAGGKVEEVPGMGFNNALGWLYIYIAALNPPHLKNPTGGGTLASVTFEVVGIGGSPITLGYETGLINVTCGFQFGSEWCYGWYQVKGGAWVPYKPWRDKLDSGRGYFDNRPPIYVDPSRVKGVPIDHNFTVNVNAAFMQDLYRWEFYMSWNTTLLNVTNITEGGFLKDQPEGTSFFSEINNDAGYIHVNCSTVGSHPGVSGNGTLSTITLHVKDRGNSNLTLYKTSLLNSSLGQMLVRAGNGSFTNLRFHEVAITKVTPNPDKVKERSNETVSIDVTVENVGDYDEKDINVTTYYEENEIGNETIPSLNVGEQTTLTFLWNTTGISRGRYFLTVRARAETTDILYNYGMYTISARDVAILSVSSPASNVYKGITAFIYVEVKNKGTELENVTVTGYYDGNTINSVDILNFGSGEINRTKLTWDTTGVPLGAYTISANITEVEDEENTADNRAVKVGKVNVIPLEEEAFPTELFLLVAVPIAVIGVTTVFYVRRRKKPAIPPEVLE